MKNIMPHNDKYQLHGFCTIYRTKDILHKGYFLNGIKVGYNEYINISSNKHIERIFYIR